MFANKLEMVFSYNIELNYSQTGTPLYASPEIWKNSHYD